MEPFWLVTGIVMMIPALEAKERARRRPRLSSADSPIRSYLSDGDRRNISALVAAQVATEGDQLSSPSRWSLARRS